MRIVLLFSLLCVCCLLQTASADDTLDKLVVLIILYLETILKHYDTIKLVSKSSIPFNSTGVIEGTLSCDALYVYGLGGLQVDKDYITFVSDSNKQTISLGLDLNITEKVGLQVEGYGADVGIISWIPVYGYGDLLLELKSITIKLALDLDYKDSIKVTNFELEPFLGATKISLTGFWNNAELSEVLSIVLTGVAEVIAAVWDQEIKCFSCAISSIIKSILNKTNIWEDLGTNCKTSCGNSSYPVISTPFNGNVSEFVKNIAEDDIVGYVEIASDYLIAQIERHL